MLDAFLAKIGEFFANAAIPFQVVSVYRSITAVWNALPLVLQVTLIACFGIACLFAVIRMIF